MECNLITAMNGITRCKPDSPRLHINVAEKPLSRWLCKECRSTKFFLLLEAIELLNIAINFPADKQAAVDEGNSAFVDIKSVIMSSALDLNKTIKVDPIRKADKHVNVGHVTKKNKRCNEKKELPIDSTEACDTTVSILDSHINAIQTMREPSLSGVAEVIKLQNKVNEWLTVNPR
ncbi:unnamed protein product [Schistosoma curassoni]|uniref:PMEI domain-containing protein n=1 Tax=Schistosoma curassoni TaxID=6186 RepID=A0A183KN07_9TREM|nr:unnamed protein product [Schistosoma curassoni]